MKYFSEYVEDYNTATLPHEKYYDVEKWELTEYKRRAAAAAAGVGSRVGSALADEEQRRRELLAQRQERQEQDFKLIMSTMDAGKIAAMKHRKSLEAQMQMHYRTGNVAEARRIEARLAPDDEDEDTAKYLHKKGVAEAAYVERRNVG